MLRIASWNAPQGPVPTHPAALRAALCSRGRPSGSLEGWRELVAGNVLHAGQAPGQPAGAQPRSSSKGPWAGLDLAAGDQPGAESNVQRESGGCDSPALHSNRLHNCQAAALLLLPQLILMSGGRPSTHPSIWCAGVVCREGAPFLTRPVCLPSLPPSSPLPLNCHFEKPLSSSPGNSTFVCSSAWGGGGHAGED